MTTATAASISQIPYKRKRPVRYRRFAEPSLNITEPTTKQAGPSPDDLYHILVLAAEGYVNLSQLK